MADALTELCVRDLRAAFKLPPSWAPLARLPAARFARVVRAFDDRVGSDGLQAAGEFILSRFTGSVSVTGTIPATGPLIVAANHPGMTDAMAIWTAMKRDDLRIIAAERDLLQLLPNIRRHLILIQPASSMAFRDALSHLKTGGSILTFPAGHIEPDAAVRPGALESLTTWSPSVVMLAERVPGTVIVPAFVRGVISIKATQSPLLRYLRDQKDRDWAAATLQILLPVYRRVSVSVAFGEPISGQMDELLRAMSDLVRVVADRNPTVSDVSDAWTEN